jgi:Xaa-Pro aminopeptidase
MNASSPPAPGSREQGERLRQLREHLAALDVDAFCLPRADEFLGEYLPPHNERLHWLTGFTGSAGMAVVLRDRAALFVDGRYTVQVRRQVSAQHYRFEHLLETPPLAWLVEELAPGARVLLDPRCCTLRWYREAVDTLGAANIEVVATVDNPVDACWHDRPAPVVHEALCLDHRYTGEDSADKRQRIGAAIDEAGADAALIFAPESVSWLLNLRGRDIPRQPVLQAFAMLEASGELQLVVDGNRLAREWQAHVGAGVTAVPESAARELLQRYRGRRVLADPDTANAWTQLTLAEADASLQAAADPVLLPKACKNATEIEGARSAHRRDAVAVVRFLAWLDREVEGGRLHDEATLADQLLALRRDGELFHEPSFDTISAAGPNAAMCHYNHLDGEPGQLVRDSLYLVDSGGQYSDGTTDITRTVAIGAPGREMCELFTLVLKGHIALATARFPRGTTGTHLDALARQFLWQRGLDYDHGTGHGVGAFLSVHEGPQRIARAWSATALAPGMIVSNEPGYYRDHAFGIRCENLCVVQAQTRPGDEREMLGFETLTLAPFDRRLVVQELLSADELAWLNNYHHRVFEALQEQLSAPDRQWLADATAPIARAPAPTMP